MKKNKNTIILDFSIKHCMDIMPGVVNELDETGNLFCLVKTAYASNGDVIGDFLDIIAYGVKLGLYYVNTIVCINPDPQIVGFRDNIQYLVWFAKNISKQFFCKDSIRESHIWEKVEWGKRAKNYNPQGKDPGNVWIPTEDDGKAHITKHIMLDKAAIINRVLSATLPSQDSQAVVYTGDDTISTIVDSRCAIIVGQDGNIESNRVVITCEPPDPGKTTIKSQVVFWTSEDMHHIPDASVTTVVTSPPYWDLKDYFKKGQIGQEPYETYLSRMVSVWQQCYNKLKDNGTLWININIRRHDNKVILIPRDFVESCKRIGFHYKGIIIWHKSSGIPTHSKNLVDRHEYVLLFSKSEDLHLKSNVMYGYSDYKNDMMNGGAIWNINRKAGSVGKHYIHPAIYPNGLVERIVSISTNEEQLVVDPFLGSGTSLIASEECNRRCVGYEYNEGFRDLIKDRIESELGLFYSVNFIEE